MKTTVIHHSADFDGLFCREIARKFLPDAELIGWDFGDPPMAPRTFETLYVMDLPIDRPLGLTNPGWADLILERGRQIVWIDHHKSAIESHPKDIPGYRIDGVAACRLAWQWFTTVGGNTPRTGPEIGIPIRPAGVLPMIQDYKNREVNEPLAVRLAGEYDIWDKRDPNAELFQHGLRSQELTDADWKLLLEERGAENAFVRHLLNNGKALQYSKTKENESIIKHIGFTIQWEGLTFLACNHARYNSFLFTAGLTPEHDACFGFKWNGKGKWEVSLYHAPGKEHLDLSLIAVKHGGGGHRGACGFVTDKLPFM